MKRRALIISCDNTQSGRLPGAKADNINMRNFLTNSLGGNWHDSEIVQLNNPLRNEVLKAVKIHLSRADYSFVVFSGHGYVDVLKNHQYLELLDSNIPLKALRSLSHRQTMIVDACRGFNINEDLLQGFGLGETIHHYTGSKSTRVLFERFVRNGYRGLAVMYSAQQGQSSMDTPRGGVYISSLIKSAFIWAGTRNNDSGISLLGAHNRAKQLITNEYSWANQSPVIIDENRRPHFPFAVKF